MPDIPLLQIWIELKDHPGLCSLCTGLGFRRAEEHKSKYPQKEGTGQGGAELLVLRADSGSCTEQLMGSESYCTMHFLKLF